MNGTQLMNPGERPKWIWPALAGVIVASLFLGWRAMQGPAIPDETAGRKIAEQFLTQIREGKAGEAWDSTTAEFKSANGKERFLRELKQNPSAKQPSEFASMQDVEVLGRPQKEFVYRTDKGKAFRLLLAHENGVWKVDRWIRD